jgi:hypothetical protein
VPEVGPDEVLIRVETAGVGQWDPFEREGGFTFSTLVWQPRARQRKTRNGSTRR